MSIFEIPKQIVVKAANKVSPGCVDRMRSISRAPEESDKLTQRVNQLEHELASLRGVVETLNRDLDESRRLNLRAAEIMDVAFAQLAK